MVQWLRLCAPHCRGAQVLSLVRELRSHRPLGAAKNKTKQNKIMLKKKKTNRLLGSTLRVLNSVGLG